MILSESRTKNTTRNIFFGLISRLVEIVFPFINRTILIYTLGAEFTGLSSLFTSILSILSIAELGFNTAIVYSMFSPIAENNKNKICELLTLFRKIYLIVGSVILSLGLLILPFIPKLVNGDVPLGINIYLIYILYLIDSAISYFLFSYKESLLIAHQRHDISHIIRTSVIMVRYILQMLILLIFKDFYLYLGISILGTIGTNLLISYETSKKYPEYKYIKNIKVKIPEEMKKQVKALLIGNICDRARNSFDSIILSALFGLTVVAIYNNYYYIYSALYGVMLIICNSMGASVGNSIATQTVEKNYKDLNKFSMIAAWISGWISICMLCIYQPFMELWMGKSLLMSDFNVVLFCIYFYAINMNNIRNQYSSGAGIWWEMRNSFIIEAISNIVLNIVLGKFLGITGIILATIITIFAFNFILRTAILFKTYFLGESLSKYLLNHLYWFISVLIAAIITGFICKNIVNNNLFITIILRVIVCCIIPNIIILLMTFKTKTFDEVKNFLLSNIINKISIKKV